MDEEILERKMQRLSIPALRAVMGDWVYYVATLSLREVARRVNFAKEIHSSKDLNELIQRRLNDRRAQKIAEYLIREEQRFFNALVVGVYAGAPKWSDFEEISPQDPTDETDIPPTAKDTFGFLSLSGEEKLFALDGQHRLAGIKIALRKNEELAEDRVTIIFVPHYSGTAGLQRTRRLFTVLNKTARPVLKGDIIALDEDDSMAICTRRLVDQCQYFNRGQVAMRLVSSLSPKDRSSWTTIAMIYDLLAILFTKIFPLCKHVKPVPLENLKNERLDEEDLDRYYDFAVQYFDILGSRFADVGSALMGSSPSKAVEEHRHLEGGSILFRPLGQKIFTQITAVLCRTQSLEDSIRTLGKLPTALDEPPFSHVVWDPDRKTMANNSTAANLAKELLLYMLREQTRTKPENLKKRYASFLGRHEDEVVLPAPVVS